MPLNLPILNEGSTAARTTFIPREPANENQEPATQDSQSFLLDLLCYLVIGILLATMAMMFALICIPFYIQQVASIIFVLTGCTNATAFHYARPIFISPLTALLNAMWHAILVIAFQDFLRRLQIKAMFERAREREARLGIQIVRHWNPGMARIRLPWRIRVEFNLRLLVGAVGRWAEGMPFEIGPLIRM